MITADELSAQAVKRMTLAAGLVSSFLAPLLFGTVVVFLLSMGEMHSQGNPIRWFLLFGLALSALPAGVLGAWAMRRGATRTRDARLVLWTAPAGALYFCAAMACLLSASMLRELLTGGDVTLPGLGTVLALLLGGTVLALMSGLPAGFGFGLLFLVSLSPMLRRIEAPTLETAAQASRHAARMFGIATVVALVCTPVLRDPLIRFLRDELGLAAPAWTAYLIVVAPLVLVGLALYVTGHRERARLLAQRSAVLRGEDAEYALGLAAPSDSGTVPFTEADQVLPSRRRLERRDGSAYRGELGATGLFVGAPERPA